MDPNANRQESVELARTVRAQITADPPVQVDDDAIVRLCELVEAADEWYRSGGFFPSAWVGMDPGRAAQVGRHSDVASLTTHQAHRTGGKCNALVTVRRAVAGAPATHVTMSVPCTLDLGHHGQCVPAEATG